MIGYCPELGCWYVVAADGRYLHHDGSWNRYAGDEGLFETLDAAEAAKG